MVKNIRQRGKLPAHDGNRVVTHLPYPLANIADDEQGQRAVNKEVVTDITWIFSVEASVLKYSPTGLYGVMLFKTMERKRSSGCKCRPASQSTPMVRRYAPAQIIASSKKTMTRARQLSLPRFLVFLDSDVRCVA
jgi:hypothetical protein